MHFGIGLACVIRTSSLLRCGKSWNASSMEPITYGAIKLICRTLFESLIAAFTGRAVTP